MWGTVTSPLHRDRDACERGQSVSISWELHTVRGSAEYFRRGVCWPPSCLHFMKLLHHKELCLHRYLDRSGQVTASNKINTLHSWNNLCRWETLFLPLCNSQSLTPLLSPLPSSYCRCHMQPCSHQPHHISRQVTASNKINTLNSGNILCCWGNCFLHLLLLGMCWPCERHWPFH